MSLNLLSVPDYDDLPRVFYLDKDGTKQWGICFSYKSFAGKVVNGESSDFDIYVYFVYDPEWNKVDVVNEDDIVEWIDK